MNKNETFVSKRKNFHDLLFFDKNQPNLNLFLGIKVKKKKFIKINLWPIWLYIIVV